MQTQNKTSSLIEKSFNSMTLEEQKVDLINKALVGKCPVRFIEGEELTWEGVLLRDHESIENAIKDLTNTTDHSLAIEIFTKGLNAIPGGKEGKKANLAVQTLADSAPQDSIEAKLVLQANALYSQGMSYLHRAEQHKHDNTM